MSVWVWIEQFKGEVVSPSWESLGVARDIASEYGGQVTACIFGEGIEALAQESISYGADQVLLADDPTLAEYRAEPFTELLVKLAEEHKPDVILMGATVRGRELSPMVAVGLDTGAIADVTSLEVVDGRIEAIRPIYAGKLLARCVISERSPQIATLRARAFPRPEADASRSGEVVKVEPALAKESIASQVLGFEVSAGEVSLTDAAIIVSGGRGVGGEEGFAPVQALAEALGAALGASRAAVDAGWIPYTNQVGQTGKVVSPDLYIACGISGAIQHQAGMRNSNIIVAVNKDPEAPIFGLAHYGIVGDLFKVLPALAQAFKEKLG